MNYYILFIYIFHSFPALLKWACVFSLFFSQSSFKVLQLQIIELLVNLFYINVHFCIHVFVCMCMFFFYLCFKKSEPRGGASDVYSR